jgi:3-methyladenine DNA glycosylase/8-oxoguanine DNA glycosylase
MKGLLKDPVESLRACDPVFGRWIDRIGELKLQRTEARTTFEALFQSIVYQQLTGRAAAAILRKTKGLFSDGDAFPSPEQIAAARVDRLRRGGLSGAKIRALKDLAKKTLDGTVPALEVLQQLEDEEIVERLTQVHGIGRWTVEMLLIFRLGRPDVLPIHDYGVRKGFGHAFRRGVLPAPKDVEKRGERWRPYRSAASWYLWRVAELGRSQSKT